MKGSGHVPRPLSRFPVCGYHPITDSFPWGDTMWDVVKAIFVVTLGLAILMAFLFLLYWLTGFLPRRWQESWRAWVFLLPAAIAMLVGLLIPALRTIYLSFFNDTSKKWVGLDNYHYIFATRGTRLTVFNSIVWVVAGTAITIIIGLAVARYA